MNTYTFFWLDGTKQVLTGDNEADALNKAGYSAGAVKALDFWAPGDKSKDYIWSKERFKWIKDS